MRFGAGQSRGAARIGALLAASGVLASAALLGGCSSTPLDTRMLAAANAGRYGLVRADLEKQLPKDQSDRAYLLTRMRLLILTLADGQPGQAEEVANQLFTLLRTQGLNDDKTTSAVVFNEDVKIWKGEPFEQALGYTYIAMQKAQRGEWDNARAAATSSLFLLKNFAENERKLSPADVAREAAARDARNKQGDVYLDSGYQPVKTNFVLGYVLSGVANRALGRTEEAADNFREAVRVDPSLESLMRDLAEGDYNTVFVVDYGFGPAKAAYGEDQALVRFAPRTASDGRGLEAAVLPGPSMKVAAPAVADINRMSADHMWNNLQDVRQAKSTIGSVLVVGGAATAVSSDDKDTQLAGAGVALLGLLLKGTSAADTRHVELLPQRVYVVPLKVEQADSVVALQVPGDVGSRMLLPGLSPPRAGEVQMRYVRLANGPGAAWATSGRVMYGNDGYSGRVEGDDLPFILGGRDVSLPSEQALRRYQAAGYLTDLSLVDLENLYREEQIALSVEDGRGESRAHVLEGGDSLVLPLGGTAGYARLFGQLHPAYKPKSALVEELAERLLGERVKRDVLEQVRTEQAVEEGAEGPR